MFDLTNPKPIFKEIATIIVILIMIILSVVSVTSCDDIKSDSNITINNDTNVTVVDECSTILIKDKNISIDKKYFATKKIINQPIHEKEVRWVKKKKKLVKKPTDKIVNKEIKKEIDVIWDEYYTMLRETKV